MERPVFSDMLSVRRRELGYSIRQASRVLRLREDVLIAFEEGNFEQMPKSGYAQGMLSSYARYLGLDAAEVVNAFTRDLERYNREMRHHRKSDRHIVGISGGRPTGDNVGQPYVRSRGLLPTSGGPAGDLGSFSTTRVRPRGFGGESIYEADDDFVGENLAHTGYETDVQTRPYTARTPRVTSRTSSSTWDATQIRTQPVDMFDYDDDLRLGNDARRFESASSDVGRRSSRHISDASRPRVQRRGDDPRGRASERNRRRGGGSAVPIAGGNLLVVAAIVAVVVITIVIVLSVSSCVSQGTEGRTVPVSAAIEAERERQEQDATATTDEGATESTGDTTGDATQAEDANAEDTSSSSTRKSDGETSVSVSVADGAVTWLEVTCDGKSDVAETITGPWQRTYTVWEALTVQAHDTTAVSVVQNGRQVQFDSIASGIGTLRIEGSGKPKKDTNSTGNDAKDNDAGNDDSSTSQTNRIGNQSAAPADETAEGDSSTTYEGDGTGDAYSTDGYDDYSGYDDYGYDYTDYGYDDGSYGYDDADYGYGYDDGSGYY